MNKTVSGRIAVLSILRCTMLFLVRSILSLPLVLAPMWLFGAEQLRLADEESIQAHTPVLIAHRGGVVGPGLPENSLSALELAAANGYAMVEVDIRMTADGVPVAFHDGQLLEHVGVEGTIEELGYYEVSKLRYREGNERILSLDEYLRRAAELDMAIMLDIKTEGSEHFFNEVKRILTAYDLNENTLTIARSEAVRHAFGQSVMHRVSADEEAAVDQGQVLDLAGKFWFGWPRYISNEQVAQYQAMGALVIPSINVFHYPEHEHMVRAEEDIRRMQDAGVRFFQIDSIYDVFF